MARWNYEIHDSDEEFPDLKTILGQPARVSHPAPMRRKISQEELGNEASISGSSRKRRNKEADPGEKASRSVTKVSCDEKQLRKQRPLKATHVNPLHLPITTTGSTQHARRLKPHVEHPEDVNFVRPSPGQTAKLSLHYSPPVPEVGAVSILDAVSSFDDLSGFIVYESASDVEPVASRSPTKRYQETKGRPVHGSARSHRFVVDDSASDREANPLNRIQRHVEESPRKPATATKTTRFPVTTVLLPRQKPKSGLIDQTSPSKDISSVTCPDSTTKSNLHLKDSTGSSDEDEHWTPAYLHFPPRYRSPQKLLDGERPVTPPPSHSKPRLQSPSKQHRTPSSPHRPSIDAFWSQEVVNDWNDHYSPEKTPKTVRSRKIHPVDENDEARLSPSVSPRKSPSKSPTKKDKRVVEQRKVFNAQKSSLATSFLKELDERINKGQVGALASSTGGIHILWSRKLNSTAGRANWKREALRSESAVGATATTTYRHHASIELAEKVIDNEGKYRLINVIAHEYCHLANFMISNIKDNPHGKEFKEWADKVSRAFSHRAVTVTTKHTYAITYKYIWACTTCSREFARHSKSIDPARQTCSSPCRGTLMQIKPAPRKGTGKKMGEEGGLSEYQIFVKRNFGRVRAENERRGEGTGLGGVMGVLGREFRELKGRKLGGGEVVGVDDDGSGDEDEGIGGVARELDFLSLG